MLGAIRSRGSAAGFKAAGGIRSIEQAAAYRDLVARELGDAACSPARLRIGASALLDRIDAALGGSHAAKADGY